MIQLEPRGPWVAFAAMLVAGLMPQAASAQGAPATMTPIEFLTCRYADGKGPSDLDTLDAAFNEWMARSEAPPYSAYVLVPRAHGRDVDFDLAWVGAWPNGATMGQSMAHYFTQGAELGPVFDTVMRCDANTQFAVLTLRPAAEEGRFGPLEVSSCTLRVGAGIDAALAAVIEWVEYFGRSGSSAAHWILFPAYGESSTATYSFKWASGYPSYEAFGRDYDEFYNGGGVDRFAALLDPLMRCDSPRLYSVRPIRVDDQALDPVRAGTP